MPCACRASTPVTFAPCWIWPGAPRLAREHDRRWRGADPQAAARWAETARALAAALMAAAAPCFPNDEPSARHADRLGAGSRAMTDDENRWLDLRGRVSEENSIAPNCGASWRESSRMGRPAHSSLVGRKNLIRAVKQANDTHGVGHRGRRKRLALSATGSR